MFTYKIRRNDSNEWLEIKCVNSNNTKIQKPLFTAELKSATPTASFTLINRNNYNDCITYILSAMEDNEKVHGAIYENNILVASGYIDTASVVIQSSMIAESVTLSIVDYITDLDNKITQNFVADKDDVDYIATGGISVTDAVNKLLEFAGLSQRVIFSSTKHIPHFVLTEDDDCTYREKIDKILFEYPGLVLYRVPDTNSYEIRKIDFTLPSSPRKINYLIKNKLKTTHKIFDEDGIQVQYPTVETKLNTEVYIADISHDYNSETGLYTGQIIEPGMYYPENGDIQAIYMEYKKDLFDRPYQEKKSRLQNSDLDLFYVRNPKIEFRADGELSLLTSEQIPALIKELGLTVNPSFYPRKVWALYYNATDKNINLDRFTIKGDATYRTKINKMTLPYDAKAPLEYESDYIFTESQAKEFATFLYNFKTISATTSTWTEFADSLNPSVLGETVLVQHKGTDKAQAHIICQIDDVALSGNVRARNITAIAISGYDDYTIKNEGYLSGSIGKRIISDKQEYYSSTSYTELTGGTWSDMMIIQPGKFIWTRRVTTYSDGSIEITDPIPSQGKDGTYVISTNIFYALTNNDTIPDASEITETTIKTPTSTERYLWKKTVITYSDGNVVTNIDLLSIYGEEGATLSLNVSKTSVEYYADNVCKDTEEITISVASNRTTWIEIGSELFKENTITIKPSDYLDNKDYITVIAKTSDGLKQSVTISKRIITGVLNISANKQSLAYYADNVPHDVNDKIILTVTSEGFYALPTLSIDGIQRTTSGANFTYEILVPDFAGKNVLNIKVECGNYSKELQLYKILDNGFVSLSANKSSFEFYADNIPHNASDFIQLNISSTGYSMQPILKIDGVTISYTDNVYNIPISAISAKEVLDIIATCDTETKSLQIVKVKDTPSLNLTLSHAIMEYYYDNVRISGDINVSVSYSGLFYAPKLICGTTEIVLDEKGYGIIEGSLFDNINTSLDVTAYTQSGINLSTTQTVVKRKRQLVLSIGVSGGQFTYDSDDNVSPEFITLTNNTVGLFNKDNVVLVLGGSLKNWIDNQYKVYPSDINGKYIAATISYDGQSTSVVLIKTYDGKTEIVEYAKNKDPDNPPIEESNFVFMDEPMIFDARNMLWITIWGEFVPEANQYEYVWRRARMKSDEPWTYSRLTGLKGKDGKAGEYLGYYTEHPTSKPNGDSLNDGDYYLNIREQGSPIPYILRNNVWTIVTANDKQWSQIASATIGDVNNYGGSLLSTSAYYGFFQALSAQNAFIQSLGTQKLTLNANGFIQSENYETTDGAEGFKIKADGDVDFNNGVWRGSFANGFSFVPPTKFKIDKTMTQKEAYQIMRKAGVHSGRYLQKRSTWNYPVNGCALNLTDCYTSWPAFTCLDYDAKKSDMAIPFSICDQKEDIEFAPGASVAIPKIINEDKYLGNIFALDIDKWIVQKLKKIVKGTTSYYDIEVDGLYLLTKDDLIDWAQSLDTAVLPMTKLDILSKVNSIVSYETNKFNPITYIYIVPEGNKFLGMDNDGIITLFAYENNAIVDKGTIIIDGSTMQNNSDNFYYFTRYIYPMFFSHDHIFPVIKYDENNPKNNKLVFLYTDNYKDFTTTKIIPLNNYPHESFFATDENGFITDALYTNGKVYVIGSYTKNNKQHIHMIIYDEASSTWFYPDDDIWDCEMYSMDGISNSYTNMYLIENYLFYTTTGHNLFRINTVTNECDNITDILLKIRTKLSMSTYGAELISNSKIYNTIANRQVLFSCINSINYDNSTNKIFLNINIIKNYLLAVDMSTQIKISTEGFIGLYIEPETLEVEFFGPYLEPYNANSGIFRDYDTIIKRTNYAASSPLISKATGEATYCDFFGRIFIKHQDLNVNEYYLKNIKSKELKKIACKYAKEGNLNNSEYINKVCEAILMTTDVQMRQSWLKDDATFIDGVNLDVGPYFTNHNSRSLINFDEELLKVNTIFPILNASAIVIREKDNKYEIALAGCNEMMVNSYFSGLFRYSSIRPYNINGDCIEQLVGDIRIMPFITIDKNSEEPVGATFYWNFPAQLIIDESIGQIVSTMLSPAFS